MTVTEATRFVQAMSFAPNGLLSKPVELVNAPSNDKWSSGVENDASFSFVPNGLLSGTRDTDSLTTLVSDSSSESNATPLHKSSDICDAEMVLDTSSLEENTTVNDHSPLLPSQTTPFTYESTSQDRVDSRLVRCKNFDGRLVFFARRQNRDKHAPVVSVSLASLSSFIVTDIAWSFTGGQPRWFTRKSSRCASSSSYG